MINNNSHYYRFFVYSFSAVASMYSSVALYLILAGMNGTVSLVALTKQLNNKLPLLFAVGTADSCV